MQAQQLGARLDMVSWSLIARRTALRFPRNVSSLSSGSRIFYAAEPLISSRGTPSAPWLLPIYHFNQAKGISTSLCVLEEVPVPSPLSQVPIAPSETPVDASGDGPPPVPPRKLHGVTVRATKTKIAQSPTKMNLVAKVVRGMRVDDALIQMKVLIKKAAQTVHEVILSARANAIHNRGYNPEKLIIAEAFVGKGEYLKRIWPHGKGRSGIRERKRCRLTVVVREMTPFEEKTLERLREKRRMGKVVRRSKLLPHRIIEARWSRPRIVKQEGVWTEIKPKPVVPRSTWN